MPVCSLLIIRQPSTAPSTHGGPILKIHDKEFAMEVLRDDFARQRGLSGREQLNDNVVMLFEFEDAQTRCFWMKDMKFFIDIVWLDADKQIVHIKEDADPDSYPESFCPPQPAKYVLEFTSGTSRELGLVIGQQLIF